MVTVRESGGDYTSLQAAIVDEVGTVTIDQTWTADDSFTGTLTITATNPITITVSDGAKHLGYPHSGTGSWHRLRKTDAGHMFTLSDNITIVGMDFQNESTTADDECFRCAVGSVTIDLTDCVGGFASRNSAQDLIFNNQPGSITPTVLLTNCAIYNCLRAVIDILTGSPAAWTIDINCCSFYDIGFSTGSGSRSGIASMTGNSDVTIRVFNSTAHIKTGVAFTENSGTGSTDLTVDRCFANQATWYLNWDTVTITDSPVSHTWTVTPGAGDLVVVESVTTPFDLRLQDDTDNDAQDVHADSTGAGLTMPSTDVLGTSRPQNTNYDAGFFEVVAAAGTVVQDPIGRGIVPFSR